MALQSLGTLPVGWLQTPGPITILGAGRGAAGAFCRLQLLGSSLRKLHPWDGPSHHAAPRRSPGHYALGRVLGRGDGRRRSHADLRRLGSLLRRLLPRDGGSHPPKRQPTAIRRGLRLRAGGWRLESSHGSPVAWESALADSILGTDLLTTRPQDAAQGTTPWATS